MNSTQQDQFYSSAAFQAFFKSSPQSLVLKADAPHFTILAVSDRYLSLVHEQRTELLGKGLFEVFPGKGSDTSERSAVSASFNRVIQTGRPDELTAFDYEISLGQAAKSGTFTWTNRNEPVLDEAGAVVYIINTTTDISTDHERAVKAAAQVKQQFELAADAARLGYWYIEPASKALRYNDVLADIFGYEGAGPMTFEQAIGQVTEDYRGKILTEIETAIATGNDYDITYTQRRFNDGEIIWLRSLGKVARDAVSGEDSFAGVVMEITGQVKNDQAIRKLNGELGSTNEKLEAANAELHHTQQGLEDMAFNAQQSEVRFRDLVQQAPVAIFVVRGKEMIFETANELMLKMLGKDNRIIGKSYSEAVPEIVGQPFLDLLSEVYTTGESFTSDDMLGVIEHEGRLTESYYKFTYRPIKNKKGATEGIICAAVDVTAQVESRKQAERNAEEMSALAKTLRDSEQRLQGILDTMAEGVGIIDTSGQLVYANKMAQRILGLTESLIKERTYDDPKWQNLRLDGTPLPGEEHPMAIMMRTALPVYDMEIGVQPPEGERFYISINAAPIVDEQGMVTGGIGTFMDVTNRRKLAIQKDDFISVASHELKTPVTSLTAALQLLDRMNGKAEPEVMARFISQANKSLVKLNGLIQDLLNTNRISQGQLQLRKTRFSIAQLINDCCSHIRTAGTHRVILNDAAAVEIYADEQQIDQVIVNLVNNAVKYAPESRDIVINVEQLKENVKISVSDSGRGIPDSKKPHLFDRYYRADHSGQQFSGLGLGLYICAEIVRKHGGEIGVVSEINQGSTFWFTLPLDEPEKH